MKKILFTLLLFTGYLHAQTYPVNPTKFGKISLNTNGISTSTTKINTQEADGQINYIDAVNLPVPTTVTNALDLKTTVSAGAVSGFTLTNNGNGTVNISSGIAYLRLTNDPYSSIVKYPISAVTNLALTDNANNYVLVDYNAGSPTITVTTNGSTINTQTNSLAYVISRVGNTLDYLNLVGQNVDPNAKLRVRFLNQEGIRRASGAILGFSNRNLTLTSSVLFSGLIRLNTAAFDTVSPDTFTLVYNNASVWTRTTAQTQVNNTEYNVSGVLTTMPNNDYRTDYVYLLPNNPSKLYVIMGTTTYNSLTLAKGAPRPSSLPVELQVLGVEVGRLFIQKNSITISEVQSSFANDFIGASVPEHNSLSGLQGGLADQRNHLDNAQVSLVNGSEQTTNKATDFTVINDIKYTSVKAVKDQLDLKAIDSEVIHKNSNPETKIGGFTSGGVVNVYANDNWIAMGTSVTRNSSYPATMAEQLSLNLTNLGVSSSTSNDLVNHYSEIPTLDYSNVNQYRLISIEHSINDAAQDVPLATFRSNLENAISHIKSKGWANEKILIINGNYCSNNPLPIDQPAYANEAVLIAKEQGVQYSDIYNYTKDNGGASLLSDGVHPTTAGGVVYARGVIASMRGGGEFSSGLTVGSGLKVLGMANVRGNQILGGDLSMGFLKAIRYTGGYINEIIPSTNTGSMVFSAGYGNSNANIDFNVSNGVNNAKFLALRILNNRSLSIPSGHIQLAGGGSVGTFSTYTNNFIPSDTGGHTTINNGYDLGNIDFNVSNGVNNAKSLALRILPNRNINIPSIPVSPLPTSGYEFLLRSTAGAGLIEKLPISSVQTSIVTGASIDAAKPNIALSTNTVNLTGAQSISGVKTFSDSPIVPTATTSVQAVNKGQLDLKANLASPVFTGTPTAPTAIAGTSTTQLATTAFVFENANPSGMLEFNVTDRTFWNNGKGNASENTSFGELSLRSNSTGNRNTAYGYGSLSATTDKGNNTAIGFYSLYNNTGSQNTAIGSESLFGNTIGIKNIAIGIDSGRYFGVGSSLNTSGNSSIFIGFDSRPLADSQTNQIVIGNDTRGKGSNTVTIGNSSVTDNYFNGKINLNTGSNASAGNATLIGGTVTVTTSAATSSSLILLTHKTSGGTLGVTDYTTTNGSFTITSNNVLDTSTYTYLIIN